MYLHGLHFLKNNYINIYKAKHSHSVSVTDLLKLFHWLGIVEVSSAVGRRAAETMFVEPKMQLIIIFAGFISVFRRMSKLPAGICVS